MAEVSEGATCAERMSKLVHDEVERLGTVRHDIGQRLWAIAEEAQSAEVERLRKYSWPLGLIVRVDDPKKYCGLGILIGWIKREWHNEPHGCVRLGNGNTWEYPESTIRVAADDERLSHLKRILGTECEGIAREYSVNKQLVHGLKQSPTPTEASNE